MKRFLLILFFLISIAGSIFIGNYVLPNDFFANIISNVSGEKLPTFDTEYNKLMFFDNSDYLSQKITVGTGEYLKYSYEDMDKTIDTYINSNIIFQVKTITADGSKSYLYREGKNTYLFDGSLNYVGDTELFKDVNTFYNLSYVDVQNYIELDLCAHTETGKIESGGRIANIDTFVIECPAKNTYKYTGNIVGTLTEQNQNYKIYGSVNLETRSYLAKVYSVDDKEKESYALKYEYSIDKNFTVPAKITTQITELKTR